MLQKKTHITRVRKRRHKACIHRAERRRKNALIFTSAQRQGQLSPSLSLSLSGVLWRRSDSWMKLQCPTCMRFWADINHEWQTLNCSTCLCVWEERRAKLLPLSLHLSASMPRQVCVSHSDQRHPSASLLCSVFPHKISLYAPNYFVIAFKVTWLLLTLPWQKNVLCYTWFTKCPDLRGLIYSNSSSVPPSLPLMKDDWHVLGRKRGGRVSPSAAWQKMGCAGMQESGKLWLWPEQTDEASRCNQAFLSDNEPACVVIQISTGSYRWRVS